MVKKTTRADQRASLIAHFVLHDWEPRAARGEKKKWTKGAVLCHPVHGVLRMNGVIAIWTAMTPSIVHDPRPRRAWSVLTLPMLQELRRRLDRAGETIAQRELGDV